MRSFVSTLVLDSMVCRIECARSVYRHVEFIDDVDCRRCHFVVKVALHLDASLSSRWHRGE